MFTKLVSGCDRSQPDPAVPKQTLPGI